MAQTVLREIQGLLNYLGGEEKRKRPAGVYPLEPTGTLEAVVSDIGETLSGARWGDEYNPSYDYEESFPIEEEAQAIWNMAIGDPVSRMGEALKSYAAGMPLARDPEMGPPQLTGIGQDVAGTLLEFAPVAGPYKRGAERIASNYMEEFMPEPQYGIMGGRQAVRRGERGLMEAMDRASKGEGRESIFSETGWYRGKDGEWRFEIDDSGSSIKNPFPTKGQLWGDIHASQLGQGKNVTVGGLLEHPELYAEYPELASMGVSVKRGAGASYRPKTSVDPAHIEIGEDVAMSDVRELIAHELNHAVQDIEGFDMGASPTDFFDTVEDFVGEKAARLETLRSLSGNQLTPQEKNELVQLWDMEERAIDEVDKYPFGRPDYYYRRNLGEAESRLAEKRLDYPPEQRGFPYEDLDVPEEELWVRGEGSAPVEARALSSEEIAKLRAEANQNRGLLDEDYRMQHRPAVKAEGTSLDDLSSIYPDDIYSGKGVQYYGDHGQNHPMDQKSIGIIQSMRGNPDGEVTIYRAVPKGVDEIREGDWVTINRDYAVEHGEGQLGGNYKVVEKKVKAKDINTEGDSIHEWGYNPVVAGASAGSLATVAGEEDNQRKRKEEPGLLGQF